MAATAEKYCIIGAGSSGLAAAKNLLAAGIPFDCLEREDDVGGNWYFGKPASSVYASTHLISSKALTEYTDFPMPEEWPEYPSHEQALEYFRSYARHFGLNERIEFNTGVEWIEPVNFLSGSGRDGRGWRVRLAGGEERVYRGVVIANGHNWDPRWPEYPGEFAGDVLHSAQYKTPDVLRGKRVLVVGGGNSGCDLAVEAAVHAKAALWSTRRAYPILPKFFRGRPIDQCGELALWLHMPLWMRRLAGALVSHIVLGPAWRTGVPKPDHKLFESHPIINSQIHHHVGHGNLQLRPDVARLDGRRVRFVDGREDDVDVIIYATGFRVTVPFIDEQHLNWRDGAPRLFLNVFHPQRDDLFVIGLLQPASGQWGLVDYQSQLVARFLQSVRDNSPRADWLRQLKATETPDLGNGVKYLSTPRHAVEVEYYSYRRRLKKLIARFSR
jgi:cation diffusion facilitator CzcD-associated flavoprotein CzcO